MGNHQKTKQAEPQYARLLAAIKAVYRANTSNFLELVTLAGLSKKTDFVGADLSGTDLSNLDLRGFRFDGALFVRCDLRGTILTGTGFRLENAGGALIDERTVADQLCKLTVITGAGADLAGPEDAIDLLLEKLNRTELLSSEGEIAVAKRIQAGRDKVISGLCELELTRHYIADWAEAIGDGDLEVAEVFDRLYVGDVSASLDIVQRAGWPGELARAYRMEQSDPKDRDEAIAVLNEIGDRLRRLNRLREKRSRALEKRKVFTRASARHYQKLLDDVAWHIHQTQIRDSCILQLAAEAHRSHEKLTAAENELVRLGVLSGITEEEFLARFKGRETDTRWLSRAGRLSRNGWKKFAIKHRDEALRLMKKIGEQVQRVGLAPAEFRRVLSDIEMGEKQVDRARKEIHEANLGLVFMIARSKQNQNSKIMGLFQSGIAGLDRAVESFHWRPHGFSFSVHAATLIAEAMSAVAEASVSAEISARGS